MAFGILVMLTALTISAVAIYYSVAGLVAIFAAAALPIIVMGSVLEVGKLVTAVWLHRYWSRAKWWLRTYLAGAVLVLMLITSMGIFGFLSKAHIEQTSAGESSAAQVLQLTTEITRQQDIISRADAQIKQLQSTGTGSDANIQSQIDKEQERIDKAFERIQPAIDEQNAIINSQAKLYQDELTRVDEQLATLQRYIDAGDKESIKKAQAMIGARQDGAWGSRTAAAAEEWRKGRQQARTDLLTKIEQATNNPQAKAARDEIQRLRKSAETQVAQSNTLIQRLRQQIGSTNRDNIDALVDEQQTRISEATAKINELTEQKYALEGEYRKLEAEVGPIKYIAEFIYGENADKNMLEEAVRWVIITIIFVFDPLAVLLLIASQYTFEFNRNKPQQLQEEETPDDPQDPEPPRTVVEPDGEDVLAQPESSTSTVRPEETTTDSEPEIKDSGTEEDSVQLIEEEQAQDPASDPASDPVKKKDEPKIIREYESVTGERIKIKADVIEKPPVKKRPEPILNVSEETDPMQKVYTQIVNDTSEANNTTWLPLQKK